MTKYYTMNDCLDACNDKDMPFIDGEFNHINKESKEVLDNYGALALSFKQIQSNKWQIKRAKPKVLSSEEWMYKNSGYGPGYWDYSFPAEYCVNAFKAGNKNGQLKQWLNHKELREHAEKLTDFSVRDSEYIATLSNLEKALGNIKPPKTD